MGMAAERVTASVLLFFCLSENLENKRKHFCPFVLLSKNSRPYVDFGCFGRTIFPLICLSLQRHIATTKMKHTPQGGPIERPG